MTQDTSLLHRSIRDNIKYGRPEASEADMLAAASAARAADFIADLVDSRGRAGFDAHVGERGVKLSGGQRQRIAIARVLLKNAPILVLDEATSALDSDVEAAIQENLEALMDGKTVIAIAHRLSTIARMDRLVVMDRGRIVETGTHAELVARGGLYAACGRARPAASSTSATPSRARRRSSQPSTRAGSTAGMVGASNVGGLMASLAHALTTAGRSCRVDTMPNRLLRPPRDAVATPRPRG